MRRKDREVTDPERIKAIIASCSCCRLGFCDKGNVYIVPLSFGYEELGSKRFFYFHSALEGRKIDLIQSQQHAGFELDTNYQVIPAQHPCGYSARFQSVIGFGKVSFLENPQEKAHALSRIMAHQTGKDGWEFPAAQLEKTCVFQLEVQELSCKERP